jgi:hypothetical protein
MCSLGVSISCLKVVWRGSVAAVALATKLEARIREPGLNHPPVSGLEAEIHLFCPIGEASAYF